MTDPKYNVTFLRGGPSRVAAVDDCVALIGIKCPEERLCKSVRTHETNLGSSCKTKQGFSGSLTSTFSLRYKELSSAS